MKQGGLIICILFALLGGIAQAEPALPIKSGRYTFQHRDAEFPHSHGFPVTVILRGRKITVVNPKPHGPIPSGVIHEARLMWHAKGKKWILGRSDADRDAPEIGGCGDGPDIIDFQARIIWTCIGGP